ncbi:MAG: hypothetical protein ACI87O_000176, partial [Planctomycetota bacterium]
AIRTFAVTGPGYSGRVHLSQVLATRLPKVFMDGVPAQASSGRFWVGEFQGAGASRGRCYLHCPASGPPSGWIHTQGATFRVAGTPDGALRLAMTVSAALSQNSCLENFSVGAQYASAITGELQAPVCGIRPLTLAIETDVQFSALFADSEQAAGWLTLNILMAQDVLRRDLSVELEVPYLGLHVYEDDWSTPDTGGSAQMLLQEFKALWPGMAPVPTQLSHFFSGVGSGLSLAGQDGICGSLESYGVHTMRLDTNGQPDSRIAGIALLHGLGHNLGAHHTQDYCPPLDFCAPTQALGNCAHVRDCSQLGTVMSSCHFCPGGLDRIELRFHPENVRTMEQRLDTCLPRRSPVLAVHSPHREPGEPWTIQIATQLELVQAPRLRYSGDTESGEVEMILIGEGRYSGSIPPAVCGDLSRTLVWLDTLQCGEVLWPEPGLQQPLENRSMQMLPTFSDDLSINRGWISLQRGAQAGYWTRAIPVADPDWPIAPSVDAGGDGWCFLTGNYWGNSDVDGGRVEVISPPIAVEFGPLQIEFEYFLGLVNENGEDRLTLECSWSGIQGPWIPVWRSGFDTGREWQSVRLSNAYLSQWERSIPGVLHLRFLAKDGSPPSVVEAAIDSVVVSSGHCP